MPPGLSPVAVLLVAALLLVPGLGITLAFQSPSSASLPVRIALAFAFGYAAIALTSFVLALLNSLTPAAFFATAGGLTAISWSFALRRAREHLRAIRDELAREWARHATFLAVLVGTVLVRATYAPVVNFVSTTLRYWADGVEIADAHRIPAFTLQWGQLLRPTTSKVLLNTFDAAMSFFLGRAPLAPTGALLFVASIALVFGAYALAEELGLRMLAPLLPVLLFVNALVGNTDLTVDLRQNLAENWGRIAMLAAVVLVVRALKRTGGETAGEEVRARGRPVGDAALGGVAFGVAAGTHLVPTVVGLALVAAYASMRMIFQRDAGRVLRTGAVTVLVAAAVGGAVLVLPKGDLGFRGAGGDKNYDALRIELGLPPNFDPTLYLMSGSIDRASRTYPYSPKDVLTDFAYRAVNMNGRDAPDRSLGWAKSLLPSLLALLGAALLLVYGDAAMRVVACTAVVFVLFLLGVSMAFAAHYHLFALATFGNRRLFNYVMIPFALIALGVGELFLRWLGRRVSDRRGWIQPAVAGAVSVAVAVVLMPSARVQQLRITGAVADVELMSWLAQHDPCDGRILADRRTLATFEAFDGRAGVIEGMGPQIRPEVLAIAMSELFRAGYFFQDPAAGLPYLQEKGVAYVVATTTDHVIGGWRQLETPDPSAMAKASFLKKVYENDAGTVYEVAGFQPNPNLPRPGDQPGYCKT